MIHYNPFPEEHEDLCWFTDSAWRKDRRGCWDWDDWNRWKKVSSHHHYVAIKLLQNEYLSQLGMSYATGRKGVRQFYDASFQV